MNTNITIKTRKAATDKVRVTSTLNIDWTGVSAEQMETLAAKALAIVWQNVVRKTDDAIPSGDVEIKAAEFISRARQPRKPQRQKTIQELFAEMSPQEQAAFLASKV